MRSLRIRFGLAVVFDLSCAREYSILPPVPCTLQTFVPHYRTEVLFLVFAVGYILVKYASSGT